MAKDSMVDFLRERDNANRLGREVIEHLSKALLAMPEMTLADGSKARVERYVDPEIGDDGAATCGVDVLLQDGSHLEFTLTNTGWGKSFATALEAAREKKKRQR